MASPGRRAHAARGRRRSRPTPRRPRRGRRHRRASRGCRAAARIPAPYVPGLEPKMRVVALPPGTPASSSSPASFARPRRGRGLGHEVLIVRPRRARRRASTASSSSPMQVGERVAEEARDAQRSRRSADGRAPRARSTSRPVMRREDGFHVGRTPSSASISAASSPWVRIAAVPQATRPIIRGSTPACSRWRSSNASASARPTSQDSSEGSDRGSTP